MLPWRQLGSLCSRLPPPRFSHSIHSSLLLLQDCLLGFLHCLQQLSVRTESHRIEILTEGSREEERILGNDDQLFSQLLKVEHPDVDGVDVHLASGHLGQAEETVEQGGLATPCPTNNTHLGVYNVKAFPKNGQTNLEIRVIREIGASSKGPDVPNHICLLQGYTLLHLLR